MKKLLFLIVGILALGTRVHAMDPEELMYVPYSSYSDVSTNGNMMFSSASVQFVGITISSPAPSSFLAIYRSTSASWTPDISTQVFIWTDYAGNNGGPQYVDLFGMRNDSYTHINKAGGAKVILWIQCPRPRLKNNERPWGFCPGLATNGQGTSKIEW